MTFSNNDFPKSSNTLFDLIRDRGFGVWLSISGSPYVKEFKPLGESETGLIIGEDSHGNAKSLHPDCNYFVPWLSEKQRVVVRWLWANNLGIVTSDLFSENEIEEFNRAGTIYYSVRLEWSRTEFEANDTYIRLINESEIKYEELKLYLKVELNKVTELEQKLEIARTALEFYAAAASLNWSETHIEFGCGCCAENRGETAREALAKIDGKEGV